MRPFRKSQVDQRKSEAYLVYSEWGPDRQIPRDERLRALIPEVDEVTRLDWMADFDRLEQEIWRFAESGGPRTHTYAQFEKQIVAAFAFMSEPALRRAWTLAGYYTAHEGY